MTNPLKPKNRQQGRSLIELMIVLVISLVVMGAVILSVTDTSLTGNQQDTQARLTEEAAIASNLLATQLRLGGYGLPRARRTVQNTNDRHYIGAPVIGCENGFDNVTAGTCNAGAANTASDAIRVMYEADQFNTSPNAAGGPATDCLGQNIPVTAISSFDGSAYAMADNRFFISTDADGVMGIYCRGNGGGAAQMLVSNVTDIQITYGVAGLSPTGNFPLYSAVQYLRADEVNALAAVQGWTGWQRVVSLRMCLLMQSDANAVTASSDRPSYMNCREQATKPDAKDTRVYRAINTVIAIRNRMPPCVRPALRALNSQDATLCAPQ